MNRIFRSIVFILFALILSLNVIAQAPEGVSYQAVVRNNSGQPLLNQAVTIRFTIHQGTPTGTTVFQEVHSASTNQFGLVNLAIGSVSTVTFSAINWGAGAYFLQVEVDPGTGFEDLGAIQLISVPYALYAKTSGNGPQGLNSLLDTTSAGALCPNGGYEVLMGLDANSNSVLDAGEITNSFIVCNGLDGAANNNDTSATNEIQTLSISNDTVFLTNGGFIVLPPGASDNDWQVSGNNLLLDPSITGNVGIGPVAPLSKLTVSSNDSLVSSFVGLNPNISAISVSGFSNAKVGAIFLAGSDSGIVALDPVSKQFFMTNTTAGGHSIVYADSSTSLYGQVIGNFAQDKIANIGTSIYNQADTIVNYSTGGTTINVNQGMFLTDSLYVLGNNQGNSNWILSNDGTGQAIWTDPSTLGLGGSLWNTNGSGIDYTTGNVGIGTNTPTSTLTINSVVGNDIEFVGGFNADIYSNSQIFMSSFGTTTIDASEIRLGTATLDRLTILNNGKIGIGTITPNSLLEVTGLTTTDSIRVTNGSGTAGNVLTDDGTGNAIWAAPSGGSLWTSNTPDIYFNTGGVGIGTTTPASMLHVNGQITVADGNFGTPAFVFDGTSTGFFRGAGDRLEFVNGGLTSLQIYQNQLRVKRGVLAAPGIVWSDETNTGIYGPGGDEIAFVNQSLETMRLTPSGNVGIGITNPLVKLHVAANSSAHTVVQASNSIAPDESAQLSLLRSRGAISAPTQVLSGDRLGKIEFVGTDNTTNFVEAASIRAIADENFGSTNHGTHLEFHTSSIGGGGGEVMRLSENGFVGLGTGAPATKLHIMGGTITIDNGANPYTFPNADGIANQVLTTDGLGNVTWQAPSGGSTDWSILGNAGTVDGTNFIGTTDNVPLTFKVNNQLSGRIDNVNGNTFFGHSSGQANTTGTWNTFVGSNAGQANTTGANNTFVGRDAGAFSTSSVANVFMGYYSGVSVSGNFNTFVGEQSGANSTSSSYSAFFGRNAGLSNTTGSNNTFIGGQAGVSNTNGQSNTAIGYNSGFSNGSLVNATAIGANAVVDVSNALVLGDNANVGIGTSAPVNKLHVNGGVTITDGTEGAGKILTSNTSGDASWQAPPPAINWGVNTSTTPIPNGTLTTLIFNNTEYTNGGGYNGATGLFQAPETGIYHVDATITFDGSGGSNHEIQLQILRNGGTYKTVTIYNDPGTPFVTAHISGDVYLPVNNTVSIAVYQQGPGTTTPTFTTPNSKVYFNGHLVR